MRPGPCHSDCLSALSRVPLRADIGTKTADHHAHMLMAIAAGKHVLCEKPFTDTAEQAREVYAAAEAKGLFCQEGMWVRYFPAYEHTKAAIELGVIGDIKGVSADYPDRVCPSSHPSLSRRQCLLAMLKTRL